MLLRYQVAMATDNNDVIMMLYCQTFMCNKSLVQNTKRKYFLIFDWSVFWIDVCVSSLYFTAKCFSRKKYLCVLGRH